MKIRYIITLILITNSHISYAQLFDSGQNPPAIKFRQINTQNFQIIYPTLLEAEAQRMANTLEHILPRLTKTLQKQPRKISIILQNQGTESNGFVQLAPRRSEFFATPPQSSDYQDWLNSLAVHELRHVVQFDKLTGYLKRPFFEELSLAIFGVTLPPWFYEGDAVAIETALTEAGRGRLPSWEIIFRSNTLSGKKYSYSKNYLGSVKDLTPGYYQLGYFMTTKLRRDFGSLILDSIFSRIKRNPLRPYNLSNSIKHFTGMTTRELHDSTVTELERLWRAQALKVERKTYATLNKRDTDIPLDYLLPVAISDSIILALKQGRAVTPTLTLIDPQGNEKTLLKIGHQKEPHFHFASNKIVWDETRFEGRFHKRSFNVINLLDIASGRHKQLTHKTRLFAPTLSPNGKVIAAVEVSYANKIFLLELDAKTGKELKRYASPGNSILQTPSFDHTGSKLIIGALSEKGTALLELDRKTETFSEVIPYQRQQISRPVYLGTDIIFKAHYNGLDNLYRLNRSTGKMAQITSAEFGAFNPSYDQHHRQVLFNNYGVNGFDIAKTGTNDNRNKAEDTFINYSAPLEAQEGAKKLFADVPTKTFPTSRYSDLNNLFYFHSLSPVIEESPFFSDYNIGLSLQSNNKLNTLDFIIGYEFNNALKESEYFTSFTYKKYFPLIRFSYHNQPRLIYQRTQTAAGTQLTPVTWRENISEANVSVPLVLNQFNHTYAISLGIGTSYTSRYNIVNKPANLISTVVFPVRYQLRLARNSTRSAIDLAPRFGQNISLSYRYFPLDEKFSGYLFTLRSRLYFPGFARNHSLQAAFNYQSNRGTYQSAIDIPYIRGYHSLKPTSELNDNLLFDYRFPLFYPDWQVGTLAYIKRLRGGFFADYENITVNRSAQPRTVGLNLQADMNLLRFYLPNFTVGTTLIFPTDKSAQSPILDFIFSYSF